MFGPLNYGHVRYTIRVHTQSGTLCGTLSRSEMSLCNNNNNNNPWLEQKQKLFCFSFFIPPPFSGWLNCRGRIAFHRLYGRWENERATGCVYLTTILRTLSLPPPLSKEEQQDLIGDVWRRFYSNCILRATSRGCADRQLLTAPDARSL